MHLNWTSLSVAERIEFLANQRTFGRERFEADRIELEQAPLSFYPGYVLIRATIRPQNITIKAPDSDADVDIKNIERVHYSYFLYNSDTRDLALKIIALTTKPDSIYVLNQLLKIRLNKDTVVDYIKFFGLCVWGGEGPFYFVTHVDEVLVGHPNDPALAERLQGALSACGSVQPDGRLQVRLVEQRGFMGGHTYRADIPCIYNDELFMATMEVSDTAFPCMVDDKRFEGLTMPEVPKLVPYHAAQPTPEWEGIVERRMKRARRLDGAMGAVTALSAMVTFFAIAAVAFDGVFAAFARGDRTWITGLLLDRPSLMIAGLTGAVAFVLIQLAHIVHLELIVRFLGGRPGPHRFILDRHKTSWSARAVAEGRRVHLAIVVAALWRAIELTLLLGFCLFVVHHLFRPTFALASANLWESPLHVLGSLLGPLGDVAFPLLTTYGLLGEDHLYAMLVAAAVYACYSIIVLRMAQMYWSFARTPSS